MKALLRQRDGELQQLQEAVSTLEQVLNVRSLEIEQLKLQLDKLRRMQFGRKSEKLDRQIEQLKTCLEDLLAEEGESRDRGATSEAPTAKQKSAHQPLPAQLPREERVLEPAEQACPSCGGELKPLGEDVSEQLARCAESDYCDYLVRGEPAKKKHAIALDDIFKTDFGRSASLPPLPFSIQRIYRLWFACVVGRCDAIPQRHADLT